MSKVRGMKGRAAQAAECQGCDDPASGTLVPRPPAKAKPHATRRGLHARSVPRCDSAEYSMEEPVSGKPVGQDVKKRPASGPQASLPRKRPAAAMVEDTTDDLLPPGTGSHLDHEQPDTTRLIQFDTMTVLAVAPGDISTMRSSEVTTLSPAVLAAIDANIGVHYPSLPRAPSPEFHSMIHNIVSAGNVVLADGLRLAEERRRLGGACS